MPKLHADKFFAFIFYKMICFVTIPNLCCASSKPKIPNLSCVQKRRYQISVGFKSDDTDIAEGTEALLRLKPKIPTLTYVALCSVVWTTVSKAIMRTIPSLTRTIKSYTYWSTEKNLENILELRNLTYVDKLRKKTNLPDL